MNAESKNVLKKSAGHLFTAGLAVCLGSGMSIIYLECIRLLADFCLTKNASGIWSIFAVFAVSIIISALLLCVQNSKALTIKQKLIESLEQKGLDVWLGQNYKKPENTEIMLPIIRNDIFTYSGQLSEFILKIAGTAVSVILTSIYVIRIEPRLFALTLLLSLTAISISACKGRKLPEQNEKLYFHMGEIYNRNAELVRNREAAYALNGERVIKPYQKEIADYKTDQARILGTMTLQRILGSANTILNTCVTLIIGGYGISRGSIEISDLIALLAALGFLTNTLYQIPGCISDYQQLKGMDGRINTLLTPQAEASDGFEEIAKITSISAQNVSFAYENEKGTFHGYLFENINFDLKSGECLILNGASGCGKSTLLKIFADILKGYNGNIICCGKNLKNIKEDSFWDRILYLSQEPQLISGTVKENITMFKAADEKKLDYALEQAGLKDLIPKFQKGMDTPVSTLNLSSGERQRICLARAFYGDYDVILSDESFSAIDPDSRREIFGKLLAQLKERSQILIMSSHTDFEHDPQGFVKILNIGNVHIADCLQR
ncbi:MAG: ABC transporter ATP-binding protein/permease [Butyrivibrio sp.]|nr:ABC transporter ATP-binding protein/permease [Acetatifactor muris]MCM1558058.1 ABC transporter ATP-binding protein/permease [Butyrivibrio sp.]